MCDVQAGSGASSNAQGEPSLEALLSSLGGLGGGGEDDEEIAGFIDHMMNAIITKDILYEPLKEMSDKVRASSPSFITRISPDYKVPCIPSFSTYTFGPKRLGTVHESIEMCS